MIAKLKGILNTAGQLYFICLRGDMLYFLQPPHTPLLSAHDLNLILFFEEIEAIWFSHTWPEICLHLDPPCLLVFCYMNRDEFLHMGRPLTFSRTLFLQSPSQREGKYLDKGVSGQRVSGFMPTPGLFLHSEDKTWIHPSAWKLCAGGSENMSALCSEGRFTSYLSMCNKSLQNLVT